MTFALMKSSDMKLKSNENAMNKYEVLGVVGEG